MTTHRYGPNGQQGEIQAQITEIDHEALKRATRETFGYIQVQLDLLAAEAKRRNRWAKIHIALQTLIFLLLVVLTIIRYA